MAIAVETHYEELPQTIATVKSMAKSVEWIAKDVDELADNMEAIEATRIFQGVEGPVFALFLSSTPEELVELSGYEHNKEALLAVEEGVADAPALERFNYLYELYSFLKELAFEEVLRNLRSQP